MKQIKIYRGSKVIPSHPGGDTFQVITFHIPSEVCVKRLALLLQEDKGQITDVYTCEWLVSSGESDLHG